MASLKGKTLGSSSSALRVSVDDKEIQRHLSRLKDGALRRATARALNKTAAKIQTRAKREIAALRNLKISDVGKALKLNKATYSELVATINATGRPIPLMDVQGVKRQGERGVTVSTGKGRRQLIEGGFIAKMPNGHLGIFLRRSAGTRRVTRTRGGKQYVSELPIVQLTVPSVPSTLLSDQVLPGLQVEADLEFTRQLRAHVIDEERGT